MSDDVLRLVCYELPKKVTVQQIDDKDYKRLTPIFHEADVFTGSVVARVKYPSWIPIDAVRQAVKLWQARQSASSEGAQ